MEVELSLESVSTLQQAREQGLLAKGRGEKASEWPSLLCSSIHRAEGEQQAHCAPKSALTLSTQAVLLGLPSSCLNTSSSSGLYELASGGNRHEHVLLPFSGSLDPRAGPQAQGQGP